jgi:hypothetical protein
MGNHGGDLVMNDPDSISESMCAEFQSALFFNESFLFRYDKRNDHIYYSPEGPSIIIMPGTGRLLPVSLQKYEAFGAKIMICEICLYKNTVMGYKSF